MSCAVTIDGMLKAPRKPNDPPYEYKITKGDSFYYAASAYVHLKNKITSELDVLKAAAVRDAEAPAPLQHILAAPAAASAAALVAAPAVALAAAPVAALVPLAPAAGNNAIVAAGNDGAAAANIDVDDLLAEDGNLMIMG